MPRKTRGGAPKLTQIDETMLPEQTRTYWADRIKGFEHPRELAIDVMFAVQAHYGYLSDEALQEASDLLGMTPLELEELATFYTFIYRQPVGRYVIHVCDSLICWMDGCEKIADYLCRKLAISPGQTTADGLFTVLPVCCIGYCDRSPAMLINRKAYGHLTTEKIDKIINKLKDEGHAEPKS
jgi:NADH-quinone oxidoreductase subunit E